MHEIDHVQPTELAAGLEAIFRPRSVAVIGATDRQGTIGYTIMHNLISYEFRGKVFPVNPKKPAIHSIKCYGSILDVPDEVDQAVIIVSRELVLPTIDQCGEKGVRGVVVITSGFKEVGTAGAASEQELLAKVRSYGMRMVGPNCFGVINSRPEVRLNTTFSRTLPYPGRVAFISQSGSLGEAILNHARRLGIGFSIFASVGNKADISENAALEYLREDDQTQIILLYLENFADARQFAEIARRITPHKPIIAIKAGTTAAGAKATVSHTGALAGMDAAVDALFSQCGVIRVQTVEEFFDLTMGLETQPLPAGPRVAVITNAGGPGIVATDAAAGLGLNLVTLEPKTVETLKTNLPPEAATGNPIDMIASAGADHYRMALSALFTDRNVDAIMCVFVPPIMIDQQAVAESIAEVAAGQTKPIVACLMGADAGMPGAEHLKKHGIPVYTYPESMARTIKLMADYAAIRARPLPSYPPLAIQQDKARNLIAQARAGANALLGQPALAVLGAYGIPIASCISCTTARHAQQAAERVGFPVVMKLDAPGLMHKTEVGGVAVNIRTSAEAAEKFESLLRRAQDHHLAGASVIVQPMVTGGIEMVLGATCDPNLGPLVMCGFGGVFVEVLKDVAFRLPPISVEDARAMVGSLRGRKLLEGFRGGPPADVETFIRCIRSVGQLVTDFPEIAELDINPFMLGPEPRSSKAVDARIILK